MRPYLPILGLALAGFVSASIVLAHSGTKPPSRTGALAVAGVPAEPSCSQCHAGGTWTATAQILGLPRVYVPDSLYSLRMRVTTSPSVTSWNGFELTAVRKSDGQGVGTFDVNGDPLMSVGTGTGSYASRRYVGDTARKVGTGSVEWSFRWRAPSTDQGKIYFFSSVVSADGLNNTSGDRVVVVRDSVEAPALLDAQEPPAAHADLLRPAVPDPMHGATTLRFSLARPAPAELTILDAQGRAVRTLLQGSQPVGEGSVRWDGTRADGTRVLPGAYWARLRIDGRPAVPARRIIVTR